MMINMERAKRVAMAGLVMTTCGFALWINEGVKAATLSDAPTKATVALAPDPATIAGAQNDARITTTQQSATAMPVTTDNSQQSGVANWMVPVKDAVQAPVPTDTRNLANQD